MIKLAVIDPGAGDITGKIAAWLQEFGSDSEVGICRFESVSAMHGFCPDVLVLAPSSVKNSGESAKPADRTACGIVLLPGDIGADADTGISGIDAGCVVTYGMSPKNTITLSSISEDACVLALQRELVTASGDVLERQEIRVHGGMKPDILLTVAGALLICGVRFPDINP